MLQKPEKFCFALFLLFAAATLFVGCALPAEVADQTKTLDAPLAREEVTVAAEKKEIPKLPEVERAAFEKYAQEMEDEIADATAVNARFAADNLKVQKTEAAERAQLADQDTWWLGPRMHRWMKIIAWVGIPLFTIIGGFLIYSGQGIGAGVTAAGAFAHFFLGVFTFGIHWVHLGIIWFAGVFSRHIAKVNAAHAVAAAAKAPAIKVPFVPASLPVGT